MLLSQFITFSFLMTENILFHNLFGFNLERISSRLE